MQLREQVAQDLLVHRRAQRRATAPDGCAFSGEIDGTVTSQPVRRLLDQRVEEELRRALHAADRCVRRNARSRV